MRSKNSWALLLMMLTGIVIGGLLGQLLPSSFLNYGQSFGLTSPIVLDLGILVLPSEFHGKLDCILQPFFII